VWRGRHDTDAWSWQDGGVPDRLADLRPLRTTAAQVARRLAEHRAVDAVLLYGSVARGDARADSDIDLFVLGPDQDQTIASLRRWVSGADPDHQTSLVLHTRESFGHLIHEGSRFLVHLRREGEVLVDRTGQLSSFLSSPWQPVSVDAEIALELERLENYDRPDIFGNRFLFPLAHVFTIGKAIVMARLADEGHFEFNRRRAFAAFASRHPNRSADARTIANLEPFLARTRRQQTALPFPPVGPAAQRGLRDGVEAVRRIAQSR
jgi:hypothetical protein